MIKWGIMGPGTIAAKFADACNLSEKAVLYGVASRSRERGEKFAQEHGVQKVYESYDAMLEDSEINAVYVAVVHTGHYELVKKCLMAGKAVLCEKPMCVSYAQTKELIQLAEEKKVLLAEGIWTHFLPCVKKAHEWMEQKKIGTVKFMNACFTFYSSVNPESRLFNKEVGGGAALDVGIYCVSMLLAFNQSGVADFHSAVYMGDTDVDEMGALLIRFNDKVVGNGIIGIQGRVGNDASIHGEVGKIRLEHFWKCRRAELYDVRGNICDTMEDEQENGFIYEVDAFCDAYEAGEIELKEVSHALSLQCAALLEKIQEQG